MTSTDINADLCAGKNYHEAMIRHGAISHPRWYRLQTSVITASVPGLQHNGTGAAAVGNPYATEGCEIIPPDTHPSQRYQDGLFHCMDHAMGFAAMVEPLTQFLIQAVQAGDSVK